MKLKGLENPYLLSLIKDPLSEPESSLSFMVGEFVKFFGGQFLTLDKLKDWFVGTDIGLLEMGQRPVVIFLTDFRRLPYLTAVTISPFPR